MFKPFIVCVCLMCASNQTLAQEKWEWSDEKASISHYFLHGSNEYQLELVRGVMADSWDMQVRISDGSQNLLKWDTHRFGAFVIKDEVIVYADFSFVASGCELIAFDLKDQKQLWRVTLKGVGPVSHSEYVNRINLELRRDQVVVYGKETAGQYIEVRNLKNGELTSHDVGPGKYMRFDIQGN